MQVTGKCRCLSVCLSLSFTGMAEHSKLHCELWGQRFGSLIWDSQIGKLITVIKNEA